MKLLVLLGLLFSYSLGNAQQVLSVNLDKIKNLTEDIASDYYYTTLFSRYKSFDTTLTPKEMHLLYYGKYFQPFYDPSSFYLEREKMFDLIKEKDFQSAIEHGKIAFKEDPLDLRTLYGLYLCHEYSQLYSEAENYSFLYYAIIGTILETGTGRKKENAFVVINIGDEQEIIASLGKKIKSFKTIKTTTDCFKFAKDEDKALNKIKKLYFNKEIPLSKTQ